MTQEDDILSTRQSLDLITDMINTAKGNIMQNSIYFILWGSITALANVGMFILLQLNVQYYYAVWALAIPAWIVTIYLSFNRASKSRSSTHLDRISAAVWMSFGILVFTLIPFGRLINFQLNPVILLMSALPTFVSGVIIKFRPLIIGGILFWISAVISFLVPQPLQYIIGAVAVVTGFLIPGIMLGKTSSRHV